MGPYFLVKIIGEAAPFFYQEDGGSQWVAGFFYWTGGFHTHFLNLKQM